MHLPTSLWIAQKACQTSSQFLASKLRCLVCLGSFDDYQLRNKKENKPAQSEAEPKSLFHLSGTVVFFLTLIRLELLLF